MERTPEEEKEYQALSQEDKLRYDFELKMDPSLSHKQITLILAAQKVAGDLTKKGTDVTTKTPPIQKTILEKMDEWLLKNAYNTWLSVKGTISNAINHLNNIIERGLDWIEEKIIDPIADFLDDLFG